MRPHQQSMAASACHQYRGVPQRPFLLAPVALLAGFAVTCLPNSSSAAPKFTTLHTFSGTDGAYPSWSGFVAGPKGSFFAETVQGGTANEGTVFQMTPPAEDGENWTLTTIYNFQGGVDGELPYGLIGDADGNLFGETYLGGTGVNCPTGGQNACGTVFELSPPPKGQTAWTKTTLYSFQYNGYDGAAPRNGLVQDAAGDLFGTTLSGPDCYGPGGCGTVFELSPPPQGQTSWTETTLYDFPKSGKDGLSPVGVPLLDAAGNLYGLALVGGSSKNSFCAPVSGCGTIYQLSPPVDGSTTWTHKTLWTFNGKDGLEPLSALSMDAAGNLFGLTNGGGSKKDCPVEGGGEVGCGTLFELSPPTGAGEWSLSVVWKFTGGKDGRLPYAAGLMPYGNKFITTTSGDEVNQYGSIDMFIPPIGSELKWKEKTLFTFTNDVNGENPTSLLFQKGKVFYGMTQGVYQNQSPAPYGTVFSIKP
jgi:hypothetical protein